MNKKDVAGIKTKVLRQHYQEELMGQRGPVSNIEGPPNKSSLFTPVWRNFRLEDRDYNEKLNKIFSKGSITL